MPAPVVPRLLSITYGSLTMGGASEYHLHNVHLEDENYDAGSVEFDVLIANTTTAGWASLLAAFKLELGKPHQALSVVMNGSTTLAVTPATNTGFLTRPKIRLLASHRTKKTCLYRVTISWVKPASYEAVTRKYRREASITLRTSDVGLRTLIVRAVYTAGGTGPGSSAFEHATTDFETYTDGLKTTLGGTWDEAEPEVTHDDEDKIASASATFRESAIPETAAGDDAGLVGVTYFVTTHRSQTDQLTGAPADAPTIVSVEFSAGVKLSASTDPEAYARDLVLTYFRTLVDLHAYAPGTLYLVDEKVRVDVRANRVGGVLAYLAVGTSLLSSALLTAEFLRTGKGYPAVLSGSPWTRDEHDGAGDRKRVIVLRTLELAEGVAGPDDPSQGPFRAAVEAAIGEGFKLLQDDAPLVADFDRRVTGGTEVLRLRQRERRALLEYAEVSTETGASDPAVNVRTETR